MKKYWNLLLCIVIGSALLLSACSKDDEDSLSVSTNKLTFVAADATAQTVNVETNVSGWTASSDESWINISRSTNSFSVSVIDNTESAKREGVIKVIAGTKSFEVAVEQEAADEEEPGEIEESE
jgi:hypothetical protein